MQIPQVGVLFLDQCSDSQSFEQGRRKSALPHLLLYESERSSDVAVGKHVSRGMELLKVHDSSFASVLLRLSCFLSLSSCEVLFSTTPLRVPFFLRIRIIF